MTRMTCMQTSKTHSLWRLARVSSFHNISIHNTSKRDVSKNVVQDSRTSIGRNIQNHLNNHRSNHFSRRLSNSGS
ncbi:hypothetical protein B0O80DRAFT_449594 [Mortierella sp. GBAus27b]|nr:hypothetical protein B0O80DRAFT_449594 [Mortierella sp. GBAus27b]